MIQYRFFLQLGEQGEIYPATPIYKDDLSLDYEHEQGQLFFREKLSGKLDFIKQDYDRIMAAPFDTINIVTIEKSVDYGETWQPLFRGKFMRTDCTINMDDKKITTSLSVLDSYEGLMNGMNKEFDLIKLTPPISHITIAKRPLLQLYIPGDNVVTCCLSNNTWEQDVTEAIDNARVLMRDYYFALDTMCLEFYVNDDTKPQFNGIYVGAIRPQTQGSFIANYVGTLYNEDASHSFYVEFEARADAHGTLYGNFKMQFKPNNGSVQFEKESLYEFPIAIHDEQIPPVSGGTYNTPLNVSFKSYAIFARYLLDVETWGDEAGTTIPTYPLPENDLVENNMNYRRAVGYVWGVGYISNRFSQTPTEYGLASDGRYFNFPSSIGSQKFYPIAPTTWRYASLWYSPFLSGATTFEKLIEEQGTKYYTLRDAYAIGDVITALLNEIAPSLQWLPNKNFSAFLYDTPNPIAEDESKVDLYITQKTNILVGYYKEPAKKAPITFAQVLALLKNAFNCYCYIDNQDNFHIEHIMWFKNGGTYSYYHDIGIDLTSALTPRSNKPWAFATSEITYDKSELPKRIKYEWQDDVLYPFIGEPIEVNSNYVQEDKIEEINVANFSPDIDYMLIRPSEFSNEGFALMNVVKMNGILHPDLSSYGAPAGATAPSNGSRYSERRYHIMDGFAPTIQGTTKEAWIRFKVQTQAQTLAFAYYDDAGNVISTDTPEHIEPDASYVWVLHIPYGCVSIGLYAPIGEPTINIWVYGLESDVKGLPLGHIEVNRTQYLEQNYMCAFPYLQEHWLKYDLPASHVRINGINYSGDALDVKRSKKQKVKYPGGEDEPNPFELVKTFIGEGECEKISLNLSSRMITANLKYATE